jgi:hypothetical protein
MFAIRDDVLALAEGNPAPVPQIQSVSMFENTGDAVDGNGLPPHSFETLIYDRDSPDPGNANKIAQAIWNGRPAGIRPYGQITATAVDEDGNGQVVQFSRVTAEPVYITFVLVTGAGYPGDTQFAIDLAAQANAFFNQRGQDVIRARLIAFAINEPGVLDVPSVKLGFSASPTGSADLTIGTRQLARFDSSRITVAP